MNTRSAGKRQFVFESFCYVPAGPFWMGAAEDDPWAEENEKPLQKVDIPYDYWLGRFLVTPDPLSVSVLSLSPEVGFMHTARTLGTPKTHPAPDVDVEIVVNLCESLNKGWNDWLPRGWRVSIPSEAEWEKAARGGLAIPETPVIVEGKQLPNAPPLTLKPNPLPQRRYPWGNEPDPRRANTRENGRQGTTSVLAHPRGASPYGVEDMVGNLWEMTRTGDALKERYEWDRDNTPLNLNLFPMYRGGAFFESQDGRARITARTVLHPNRWTLGDGVRLVLIPDEALPPPPTAQRSGAVG